jgi:DNA polymerase I
LKLVRNVDEALELLKDETEIAWDLETSGISPFRDKIAVVSMYGDKSDVAAVLHVRGHVPEKLKRFFERPGILYTGHNTTNFDWPFLHNAGVNVFNGQRFFDTLTGSTVATVSGRKSVKQKLDVVLQRELGTEIDKSIVDHGSWMDPVLNENQVTYCYSDIIHLPALRRKIEAKCKEQGQTEALQLEMDIIPGVLRMIVNGMPVDEAAFDEYLAKQRANKTQFREVLVALLGEINFNSPAQVKKAFKEAVGLQLESTSRDALKLQVYGETFDYDSDYEDNLIDDEVTNEGHKIVALLQEREFDSFTKEEKKYLTIKLFLAFRVAEQRIKMFDASYDANGILKKQSWWDKYVTNGKVHCTYWQCSTDTGRWSSSNPNLQQVPTDMRKVFGNLPGHKLVSCDYSQIEVWVMALLSNDPNMLEYLESGDMHTRLGQNAFKLDQQLDIKAWKKAHPVERKKAKAMVFALLFGGGARRLYEYMRSNGVETSMEEATRLYLEFSKLFPRFHAFREGARIRCANAKAIPIQLPSGLVRVLAGPSLKYTTFLNTSVQGSAAAGLKNGLRMLIRAGYDQYLAAAVHDELVLVVPDEDAAFYGKTTAEFMVKGMRQMLVKRNPLAATAGIKADNGIGLTWQHEE